MSKEKGLFQDDNSDPGEGLDDTPDIRTGTGKDLASMFENQCLTFQEIEEMEWNK
jgi:hypothetical protein